MTLPPRPDLRLERLMIDSIRVLAMDAVQQAGSGHPGTPMALAPLGYTLWMRHLRYNPTNPQWMDRDRFVLSVGHASMLLYSLLHLTGYDLSLEELVNFRQWGTRTPGHPEVHVTPGVEATTGPLGQGVANSVGMAIAEALARGLPIISTTGGAIPDTIPPDVGLFVSPGDDRALADALSAFLGDGFGTSLRSACAVAARKHAATLPSWEIVVNEMKEALIVLANAPAPSGVLAR